MTLREAIIEKLEERARWKSNYKGGLLKKIIANKEKFAKSQTGSAQKMSKLRTAYKANKAKTQGLLGKVKSNLAAKAGARSRMRMQKAAGVR